MFTVLVLLLRISLTVDVDWSISAAIPHAFLLPCWHRIPAPSLVAARSRERSSFFWKSSIPEENATPPPSLPVFSFSHYPPYVPFEENNTENISLHKTLVPESWSTSENLGSINIDKLPRSLVDDSHLGIWSLASLDAKR